MPRLALLERDGVLNRDLPDFVRDPGALVMLPGAAEAVRRLNEAGYLVAVATNQPCVGLGMIDAAMLERIHETLRDHLARTGARLDLILHAPDAPHGASPRRKPGAAMLVEAMRRFGAPPYDTVMIGDTLDDLRAAVAADVPRILVRTGRGRAAQAAGIGRDLLPVRIADDLAGAVDLLLGAAPDEGGA